MTRSATVMRQRVLVTVTRHPYSSRVSRHLSSMTEIFGIPTQALFGQLLIGLINGSFYALLSLGLAVIFGLLNIINFAHGAQYMMGAFCAWFLLNKLGLSVLVGARARAAHRRRDRHRDRAPDALAALQARSSVRVPAHVRPRARHPGAVPAASSARRACPTRCRRRSKAGRTWASCSCRTTARG